MLKKGMNYIREYFYNNSIFEFVILLMIALIVAVLIITVEVFIIYYVGNFALETFSVDFRLTVKQSFVIYLVFSTVGNFSKNTSSEN